ncbi:hypothetical protein VTI74DRAFT_5276 [Chaetomium olivicolor]
MVAVGRTSDARADDKEGGEEVGGGLARSPGCGAEAAANWAKGRLESDNYQQDTILFIAPSKGYFQLETQEAQDTIKGRGRKGGLGFEAGYYAWYLLRCRNLVARPPSVRQESLQRLRPFMHPCKFLKSAPPRQQSHPQCPRACGIPDMTLAGNEQTHILQ